MHHARGMAKAINVLKIWHFRRLFKVTANIEKGLWMICCFVVLVYFKSWFTAPSSVPAPRRDLNLTKALLNYSTINSDSHIGEATTPLGSTLFVKDMSSAIK